MSGRSANDTNGSWGRILPHDNSDKFKASARESDAVECEGCSEERLKQVVKHTPSANVSSDDKR